MPSMTPAQYEDYLRRHAIAARENAPTPGLYEADERETGPGGLHQKIIDYCNSQWPRWKFRYSRPDKKTHEELGVEDFTIFASGGRTFHFECKAKGGKLSEEQRDWKHEMDRVGHCVFVIYSMEEFKDVVKGDL